jgi:queuine tRNA-ribosyltransferase
MEDLKEGINAPMVLSNTYHLYLRPGTDLINKAGGLHEFMNWDRPILTDSGGYQVYSLSDIRKIKEDGVEFRSHIDGSKHLFTPAGVMDIQRNIGADIIMAFDECTPYPCELDYATDSMKLTHEWLDLCCDRFDSTEGLYGYDQTLFPIVQGSTYPDLRKQSAEYIASKDREGNAIGGLSVGEPEEDLYAMTDLVCNILPWEKPRYLMGVGTPANILECIGLGIDMFDCVMPTRNARNGMLFTTQGIVNLRNKKWEEDLTPLDPENDHYVSQTYSKAYVKHLLAANELQGLRLASTHNLSFYLNLVRQAREQIIKGEYDRWKDKMIKQVTNRL